ncbi:MAG: hypothetical protein HYZ53_12840 [Planctomycetes bacterium]|nr:hypothetical protein [Planctomycetota bacterium]
MQKTSALRSPRAALPPMRGLSPAARPRAQDFDHPGAAVNLGWKELLPPQAHLELEPPHFDARWSKLLVPLGAK